MGSSWSSLLGGELWELEVTPEELLGLLSQNGGVWLDDGLDDVDGISSGTMSTGHLLVHVGNGTAESGGSVLLVHVNNISSCSILKYDSVVLHGIGLLLEDLGNGNDLSLDLSNLVLSLHLIPEVGSGDDDVLSENSDSEAGWLRIGFTRKFSTDNPVLFNLKINIKINIHAEDCCITKTQIIEFAFSWPFSWAPFFIAEKEGAIDLRFFAWLGLRHL